LAVKMHENVVDEAKKQAKEQAYQVDWLTGEIKNKAVAFLDGLWTNDNGVGTSGGMIHHQPTISNKKVLVSNDFSKKVLNTSDDSNSKANSKFTPKSNLGSKSNSDINIKIQKMEVTDTKKLKLKFEKKLNSINFKIQNLIDLAADGSLPKSAINSKYLELTKNSEEIKIKLASLEESTTNIRNLEDITNNIDKIKKAFKSEDLKVRNQIYKSLISKIIVHDDDIEIISPFSLSYLLQNDSTCTGIHSSYHNHLTRICITAINSSNSNFSIL